MDTEKKLENKPTDKADTALEPKTIEGKDEKTPAKTIKRQATQEQLDHPLHGVKLVQILESLVEHYGWKYLADEVNILCFKHNPTMKISLKFLRKFKWAREHVEDLYMDMLEEEVYQKRK
jgi:uncharacterized protein (DUF2132 family)